MVEYKWTAHGESLRVTESYFYRDGNRVYTSYLLLEEFLRLAKENEDLRTAFIDPKRRAIGIPQRRGKAKFVFITEEEEELAAENVTEGWRKKYSKGAK